MTDSDSIILAYAKPKSANQERWFVIEVISASILFVDAVLLAAAFLKAAGGSEYGGYAAIAYVFMAVWVCCALECIALILALAAAKRRDRTTWLVGMHALLLAILGIMSLPAIF